MVWDTTILTPRTISTLTEKSGQEYTDVTGAVINQWSYKKQKNIPVLDFFLNFGDIIWNGRSITVELELHKMIVRQWMRESGKTYAEIMDDIFEMAEYGEDKPRVLENSQTNSKL